MEVPGIARASPSVPNSIVQPMRCIQAGRRVSSNTGISSDRLCVCKNSAISHQLCFLTYPLSLSASPRLYEAREDAQSNALA